MKALWLSQREQIEEGRQALYQGSERKSDAIKGFKVKNIRNINYKRAKNNSLDSYLAHFLYPIFPPEIKISYFPKSPTTHQYHNF